MCDTLPAAEFSVTEHEGLLFHVEVKCCAATAVQDTTQEKTLSTGNIQDTLHVLYESYMFVIKVVHI